MTWILTQSGQQFDLLRPTASMIKPVDIAHALSRLCRFNGHTRAHYSVAQHSLIVASLVPGEHQLVALATERRDLMPEHPGEWDCLRGVQPMKDTIVPLPADYASMAFFTQLMNLMQSNHRRRYAA